MDLFKNHPIHVAFLFFVLLLILLSIFDLFLFAPKILVLAIILIIALFLGKLQLFLKDWFVFLSFVYLSDSLRGLIYTLTCKFSLPVYTVYVIKLEKFFFGMFPSSALQKILLKGENYTDLTWLEKFLTIIHGTHFIAFLLVGFIVWIYKSNYLNSYKTSFYLLISIGIFLYFLVPTAPPWIAYELFEIIPKIIRFNVVLYNMSIPDLTSRFNTNLIAAMPSLHAAFPALCSLILWKLYRWRAFLFYIYTLLIFFTIVYTGDHYIVDILAGLLLTFFCYFYAFKIRKTDTASQEVKSTEKKQRNKFFKYNHIILGTLILAAGISIGFPVKNRFESNLNLYDIHAAVPNYVDFFDHIEKYRDNFKIQYNYGNHLIHKEKYEEALFYFKQAQGLSRNFLERKQTLMKIKQCESILSRKEINTE